MQFTTQRRDFTSQGERCAADLYLPQGDTCPPVILMAHGFAAERRFGLPPFASHFAQNGLAVLLFDYRNFGESEGKPRQWVDPARHLQDWQAAIAHARALPEVDGQRMALWGSSYSGGHVLVTAANTPGIRAVVAQVPHVDALASLTHLGMAYVLRNLPAIARDLWRMASGQPPYYVKAVAEPQEAAAINTPESYPGYAALIPEDADWDNRVPGRSLLSFVFYSPIRHAARITCPTLLMLGERDSLIPPRAIERAAARIRQAELVRYDIGHFDIYRGVWFEQAVARQAQFLRAHLS